MKRKLTVTVGLLAAATMSQSTDLAVAQVETKVESATSTGFTFPSIPAPSDTDATNIAKIRLIRGRADGNAAPIKVLTDGVLPDEQDQPSKNFFLSGRSGWLLLEWEESISVQALQLYSWHPGARRAQKYRVWAPGQDTDLEQLKSRTPRLGRGESLEEAGWKSIAEVETSQVDDAGPDNSPLATQVKWAEPLATSLLLVELEIPNAENRQSGTFYSELDVIDGQQHEMPSLEGHLDSVVTKDGHEIFFDTTDLPEIREWVNRELKPACLEWYPKIVDLLPSEDFTPPEKFTIFFHANMDGVAYTQGKDVHCAGVWFMRNLNGEAEGAVVHELVHVVQQYRTRRRGFRNPSWMVEGVADYIRWFMYEPETNRPRVNFQRSNFDDSYRTSAAFMDYVIRTYDKDLLAKFNAALRESRYNEESWEEWTGKTPADLWNEFKEESQKAK